MGIQALKDKDLMMLGRNHNVKQAFKAVNIGNDLFENVSLDFIWGRPNQSLQEWRNELEVLIEFK